MQCDSLSVRPLSCAKGLCDHWFVPEHTQEHIINPHELLTLKCLYNVRHEPQDGFTHMLVPGHVWYRSPGSVEYKLPGAAMSGFKDKSYAYKHQHNTTLIVSQLLVIR